jgi:FAD/FMN-containing dehydrogenase
MSDKKAELIELVGSDHVWDGPEILAAYSQDHSFVPPRRPQFIVQPGNSDEIQSLVKWANRTNTPLVPVSSGPPHFRGDTIPSIGGAVIVDLSRMKRVIRIDRRNRMVMIEPGVTFGQLIPELAKEGLKLSMPLLPRINKSVVGSLLEREPILIPRYQWTLLEPLRCLEVIWGDGSRLLTGDVGPWGPLERQWEMGHAQVMPLGWGQTDYYRFISGSQGTMGIVTWATVKCEILPQVHKAFLVASEKLEALLGFAYRILRIKYADEFLFLNNSNLAYILGEKTSRILSLRGEIPPWIVILGVAGRERLAEKRVEYQEEDMSEIAQQFGLQLSPAVPGARGEEVLKALLTPCEEPFWKLRYKGGCQDIFFLTTLDRIPEFVEAMHGLSEAHGYSPLEMGIYIQPLNRGVGCHCEFSLPYDPGDHREAVKIQRFLNHACEELINQRAYFSRPYGSWAETTYSRDAESTIVLRKIKKIFDPNNVMNPGKLCF